MKIPTADLVARLRSIPIDLDAAQLMEAAANHIEELEGEAQEAARVILQMQARIAELEKRAGPPLSI